jgi:hypothetical protein
MAKLNLGYTEGMNQDMGFDKRSPNQYYDAMNIKIVNNGSNFCITNSDGEHLIETPIIVIDTDKGILGQAKITNGVVLFVHGRTISHMIPPITYYNYGYFVIPITDNDGELKVWPASPLYVSLESSNDQNWKGPKESIGRNIDFVSIIEGNKDKIYFVDGENQMRIITIDKNQLGEPYVEKISDSTPKPKPLYIITDLVEGSSTLKYGEYQYMILQSTEQGITTNPSYISNKITINKNNSNNKQIKIDVNLFNNDSNNSKLNYLYVYRIKYLDNDISVQLIQKQKINASTNYEQIILFDDGNSFLQEISLEEFNSLYKNTIKPKTISSIYNRLVLGNAKSYDNFDFLSDKNFDVRAYSYILDYTSNNVEVINPRRVNGVYRESLENSSKTVITINSGLPYTANDYTSVEEDSNCILNTSSYGLFKEVFNDINGNIVEGAAGKNIKMVVEGGSDGESGSFVAGETYRFGIVFYDEYMNISPVKWVCDYTFPEYNPLNIINPTGKLKYDYFRHSLYNVYFELLNQDKFYNKGIRAFDICYVKRTPENSNIVDFAICVPGFTNNDCNRVDKPLGSLTSTAPHDPDWPNSATAKFTANGNFIMDRDFENVSSNNICLPYQIMKDIVVANENTTGSNEFVKKYDVPIRYPSSGSTTVFNDYFFIRGGRLSVDNDYGFDWDCANDVNYAPGLRSTIHFKKPTRAQISYFYSPLISVGYVGSFSYIKPYCVLENGIALARPEDPKYNKTHMFGSRWDNSGVTEFIALGDSTYESYDDLDSKYPVFPYRTGWSKNVLLNEGEVVSYNGRNAGSQNIKDPTCSLFCPRSNKSSKWDQTGVYKDNKPINFGYQSSYFVRQYYANWGITQYRNCSMYRSDYISSDPFEYSPSFVQYENNGEYVYRDNLRVSNAGKLADFYPVPWSKDISKNSISDIEYMQLDCNYANTIATSFNYTFDECLKMVEDRTKSTDEPAISYNRRYQILFQLRNKLSNQYGGNSYYNKINNSYIICTERPILIPDNNSDKVYCQGDMKWGSFTIPRVWCNNDGGEDLLITNTNAALIRHNEFVTVFNVPTRIIDYDRNDFFATNNIESDISAKEILDKEYDSFCKSSIKYDDKEVLNISSSIYENPRIKEYFPIDYSKIITDYPTKLYASNVKISGEEIENWAIFPVNETLDLDGSYGEIVKVINHNGKLYAFQENGIAFISAQPRVLLDTNDNVDIQLGTGKYFDRYEMLSTNSGIKNLNAVSGGYDNLYYIDANKNALFNLMNDNEEISLSKGMFKYFNDNTTVGARCFYDLKERKLYVLLDESKEGITHNSLIYSEIIGAFETRLSSYPVEIFNINDHTLSYYNKSYTNSTKCNLYELKQEFNLTTNPYIQFLVNPNGNNYIRYDVVEYTQQELDEYRKSNVNLFNIKNYYQDATSSIDDNSLNIKNKFSIFRITVPRDKNLDEYNKNGLRRIFSPQAFIKLQFDGSHHITSNLNLNFY